MHSRGWPHSGPMPHPKPPGPGSNPGTVSPDDVRRLALLTDALKQRIRSLLDLAPGQRVLDVGCGPGLDTAAAAECVGPAGRVAGIDYDPSMIRDARARTIAERAATRESGIRWPTRRTSRTERARSIGATANVCYSIRQTPRRSSEMGRVTKPGGVIVVADTDWATLSIDAPEPAVERALVRFVGDTLRNGFAGRQLRRLMKNEGLTEVGVEMWPIVWTDYKVFRATSLSLLDMDERAVGMERFPPLLWPSSMKRSPMRIVGASSLPARPWSSRMGDERARDATTNRIGRGGGDMAPNSRTNGDQARPLCFVIGPYGERDSKTRKWSDFLFSEVIEPALRDEYLVQRTIDSPETGQISGRIKRDLNSARLVIADLTADNANVYYELGFRHAIDRPFIHLVRADNPKLPFDLQDFEVISVQADYVEVPKLLHQPPGPPAAGAQHPSRPGRADRRQSVSANEAGPFSAKVYRWDMFYSPNIASDWLAAQPDAIRKQMDPTRVAAVPIRSPRSR